MAAVKGLNFKVSATAAGLSALSSFTRALSGIGSAGTVATNSMQGFSSELRRQQQQYDAVSALAKTYAADAGVVDRALKLGAISTDEWAAATGRLKANWSAAEFAMMFDAGGSTGAAFLAKFNAELERLTLKFNPAKQAAATFDAAVLELNRALDLGAINVVEYENALQKLPGSTAAIIVETDRLKLSFKSAADAASVFDTEFNRLQAKFNPAAAEIQRLSLEQAELTRAMRLGVISAEKYDIAMTHLKGSVNRLSGAQSAILPVNGRWNRGLSDSSRAIQQAGFQVNDFFIQVAGGQNIILAMTQQLGQLVQFFGTKGSVAGAFLSIGGALWLMFGDVKTAVEKLTSANDLLGESLSNLSGFGGMSLDELKAKYGEVDAALLLLLEHQHEYDAMLANKAAVEALNAVYGVFSTRLGSIKNQSRDGTVAMQSLRAELGFSAQEAQDFARAFETAMAADDLESKVAAFAVLEGFLSRSRLSGTELTNQLRASVFKLKEIVAVQDDSAVAAGEVGAAIAEASIYMRNFGLGAERANTYLVRSREEAEALAVAQANFNAGALGVAPWASMVYANLVRSREEAEALANTNVSTGVKAAAEWASSLWSNLVGAAAAARAIAADPSLAAPGTAANERWQRMQYGLGQKAARDATNPLYNPPIVPDAGVGAGDSGGGGGGTSPIEQLRADYANLMAGMDPVIASTKQFRDATAAAMAAFEDGNVEGVKSALEDAVGVAKDFKSVADSISSAFMSAFSGVLKGTKSVKDAAMDMLNTVLDKTIELLMAPVFDGIAGGISSLLFGAIGGLGGMPSHEGGGYTGNGARSGGLDGKGGFLSIMHPKETVTDHTRGGGGMGGGGVTINVMVDGATGNGEIMEMVSRGVSTGLQYYDAKVLPQSLKRVSANPRRM